MAINEIYSGSASIGTTEYDLPSASTTLGAQLHDGVFQVFLDMSAMTANEQYIVRIYEKTRSASTQRLVDSVTLSGVQAEPVYATPALLLLHGWTVTLQRVNTGGSSADRTIEWSIRQVA